MVVQHDFFGAKERPRCDTPPRQVSAPQREGAASRAESGERRDPRVAAPMEGAFLPGRARVTPTPLCPRSAARLHSPVRCDAQVDGGMASCGIRTPGLALLNIGLVYLRSAPGGGVHAVINGTWARFIERVGDKPSRPPHLGGAVDTQQLIDQPFMREVANTLAVADDAVVPRKPAQMWATIPGSAGEVYDEPTDCALGDAKLCAQVRAERRKTAFLSQLVMPRRQSGGQRRVAERIALAPDWLFGRGCLTHMRRPAAFLQATSPGSD
eukprot:4259906-Prymnesium_polylepis.1